MSLSPGPRQADQPRQAASPRRAARQPASAAPPCVTGDRASIGLAWFGGGGGESRKVLGIRGSVANPTRGRKSWKGEGRGGGRGTFGRLSARLGSPTSKLRLSPGRRNLDCWPAYCGMGRDGPGAEPGVHVNLGSTFIFLAFYFLVGKSTRPLRTCR